MAPEAVPAPRAAAPARGAGLGRILLGAGREALADHVPALAASLAYSGFLALPSALLVALGAFGIVARPADVTALVGHLHGVMPPSAIDLLETSLRRTAGAQRGGIAMVAVGAVLAIWTLTGAMTTLIWALDVAFEREERRGFLRQRLVALGMLGCVLLAVVLAFGLLVLGPELSGWLGDAIGEPRAVRLVWWIAEWPILLGGLLAAFAGIYRLGPDRDAPRLRFATLGAGFALLVWLAASAAFSIYASRFSSYDKTWGSLAAVIAMLTWLWVSALALLVGAEIDAEAERVRGERPPA